ncbi:PilZ domain-containing protein [Planococcus sp. S3-L1]|uniref:PilZ domain-containing protein n=1 Tax=Planococcus sp. S3-L1 TaxID=3046200 RepID=UPI0024BB911D|nr:PilZ domain-containing protein [Planococcus sp. S3-L1]MDJ0331371.1 PilZ domain-containing protein [Planococcus sp. S3-L1]
MSENRREFFRVIFNQALNGKVSVYGGSFLPVEIYDVSAGGLVFSSVLNIPLGESVRCSFELVDSAFLIEGTVVRKATGIDVVECGVEFSVDQGTSSELFKQLNHYQIRNRKSFLTD